jgi:hypothetical protein
MNRQDAKSAKGKREFYKDFKSARLEGGRAEGK